MIEDKLREYLMDLGAVLVGFSDLSEIDTSFCDDMKYGVAFAINIKPEIIKGIKLGPTEEYYKEYQRLNKELDELGMQCVKFIETYGYKAIAQTTTHVASDNNMKTPIPHKTVARLAGLGWIGKNALLITPEYGSAVRISTVITDMPLKADSPMDDTRCGECTACKNACPGDAIKGRLWERYLSREELIDPVKCREKARQLSSDNFGVKITICGKCIEICPYTQRYIKNT